MDYDSLEQSFSRSIFLPIARIKRFKGVFEMKGVAYEAFHIYPALVYQKYCLLEAICGVPNRPWWKRWKLEYLK